MFEPAVLCRAQQFRNRPNMMIVVQFERKVRIRVCLKRLRKNASLDKERPPGLKPALISRGLRGPFDKLRAGLRGTAEAAVATCVISLAGDGLDPGGECVPGACVGDGYPNLLDDDEESARPDRDAMNAARRPQVVGHQNEQEDVGAKCGRERVPVTPDWPAGDGSDHQSYRADKDEALVGRGIGAATEGKKDQGGEDEHVGQGNDVEGFGIEARGTGIADEGKGGG